MLISQYCAVPQYVFLHHSNTECQWEEMKEAQITSWCPQGSVGHNAHRRYLRWCWLTGYRCRFYGKKSSSQRGVGCSAPGLGSVPHRAAPSLRASEAATCSWSGCLDGGMRMTLCGLWNGINESNLKYISIPWIILSLYSENTIFDTQKKTCTVILLMVSP